MVIQAEIDDFPDYKYEEVWQQKCWDILYLLYYDIDSGVFVQEISEESMGRELYLDYVDHVETPINFLMIKEKMKKHMYGEPQDYIDDMNLAFDNCTRYHKRGSAIHKSAQKMKRRLRELLRQRNMAQH